MTDKTKTAIVKAPYYRFVQAATMHGISSMLRRKRTVLAGLMVLAPVLAPLLLAMFTQGSTASEGSKIFVMMSEYLFLKALIPLLALFFGAMLIGEDIESQTIPYLLTRPLPRSALVLGRFMAFLIVGAFLILPALVLTFVACTALPNFGITAENIKLMIQYMGVLMAGLIGYGALCMCIGVFFKRPIVIGILFLFGWQRLAAFAPGLIDFLTIEKYVTALLPPLAEGRDNVVLKTALMEFHKKEFLVGATKAGITLFIITAVLLILTTWIIRWREYSQARAMDA